MNSSSLIPTDATTTPQPRVVTLQLDSNPKPSAGPASAPPSSNVPNPNGQDSDLRSSSESPTANASEPGPELTQAARRCGNGHAVAEDDAKFCTTCGVSLSVEWVTAKPVGRPVPASLSVVAPNESVGSPAALNRTAIGQPAPIASSSNLTTSVASCSTCQGGSALADDLDVCPDCRQLRPLTTGYEIDLASFQWAFDGQAMAKLRTIGPLNAMARKVSDQIGRRWIETTFNGVRTSSRQMPNVYKPAVHAAKILGLNKMPDVYVSGERPWDALTFGSDESAFIVIGSALVGSFRGPELGFLFAREMGHIRAGHALWKTVIRFLVGEHNPRSGLMRNGIVGLLDPGKWIEGAIEVPLLNWARQAEITADRAGLLALGNAPIVRRVLLSWSLKSPLLYRFVNQQAWLQQQEEDGTDEGIRLTEMVTSSTPYISRRLKLLAEYEQSSEFLAARQRIKNVLDQRAAKRGSIERSTEQRIPEKRNAGGTNTPQATRSESPSSRQGESASPFVHCPGCRQKIRVPLEQGRERMAVRCPNSDCHKVLQLERKHVPQTKRREQTLRNLQAVDD